MTATAILSLLGGLGLFLFGLHAMSEGLEQAAGQRMKKLMEALTKNRLLAVLIGALVTGVIQSSSATTVMVIGFVNAGLLKLGQAVGVIMGANIGTTVTSLMLSVKLDFGMIFAALGGVCLLFGQKSAFRALGQILLGLGVLFVGMNTMTAAMQPLSAWQGFQDFMVIAKNPFVGVLAGTVITALLQSSSASIGILQALAASGAISLEASLFILFGQNIGTCVTALLAAMGASKTAKRAAVIHLLFNVIGSLLFILIAVLCPLTDLVTTLAGDNLRLQISVAHILFNVGTTLVLLPAAGLMERMACLLVRGEDAQPATLKLQYFDTRLLLTPPIAAQQLFREVLRMADIAKQNFSLAMLAFVDVEKVDKDAFALQEEELDFLNAEITQQLVAVRALALSNQDVHLTGSLFHVVNDLERIGDHSVNIMDIAQERKKEETRFSQKAEDEIFKVAALVEDMLKNSLHVIRLQKNDLALIGQVLQSEAEVDTLCKKYVDHHIARIKNKKCTPRNGMLYMDMLSNLERIADHADNLATSIDTGEGLTAHP